MTGPTVEPTERWRELLEQRRDEAVGVLGAVPGVRGLVVGGSVGRGEPWPLSDIDVLPVYGGSFAPAREVERRHAMLIDWWAASGRAQTLDVGWLAFTDDEVRQAAAGGPVEAAVRMTDLRWFHGIDKAFGGRAAADPEGLAQAFLTWVAQVRFHPLVVAARTDHWWRQATTAQEDAAVALADQDPIAAAAGLREAAGALVQLMIERWGERSGSMGRFWTRFERLAGERGAAELGARLVTLAGADPGELRRRVEQAPVWLRERIDLAAAARRWVGEPVSAEQNARDQLLAFSVHVARRRPDLAGPWTEPPAPGPDMGERLAELDRLTTVIDRQGRPPPPAGGRRA